MAVNLSEYRDRLRAEAEDLAVRREIRELEFSNLAGRRVIGETGKLMEAWGDVVDRTEFLRDTEGFFPSGGHRLSVPRNRQNGDFAPFFQSEQDLQIIRGQAQWLTTRHPIAIGLLDDLANYTISTGFTYTANPKDTGLAMMMMEPLLEEEVLAVQEVMDEFVARVNGNFPEFSFERELFKRSREAGEFFVHVEPLEDGLADLTIAEPEWVGEPVMVKPFEDYKKFNRKYGIATEKHSATKIKGYFVMWNGEHEQWEVYQPQELLHCKINVPRNVKRGLSDFYGIDTYLEDHARLLKNTARGAAIQAAIALIREHQTGMRGADVTRLVAGQTEAVPDFRAVSGRTVQRRIKEYSEGTVLDVVGSKYIAGPLGVANGPTYMEIAQAVVRVIGARWSMPEHMISNAISGAGGGRAAIVEAGTPFARWIKVRQAGYAYYFEEILWRVLEIAGRAGLVPPIERLKSLLEIKVGTPEATQRSDAEQHLVLAGRYQAQVISKRTWQETIGVDPETENERIMNEQMMLPGLGGEDQLGANSSNETVDKQAAGGPGNGEVGRQNLQGAGSDMRLQDRFPGPRNAAQSIRQKLAAGRAGKNVEPI